MTWLFLNLLQKLLLMMSMWMTSLTVLIRLSNDVSFCWTDLSWKSNSCSTRWWIRHWLLRQLHSPHLTWNLLHSEIMLCKPSSTMRIWRVHVMRILVRQMRINQVMSAFIVKLSSIWTCASLWYKMSSTYLWTLCASCIAVLTNIIVSFLLRIFKLFTLNWWDKAAWSLWAHSLIS